MATLILPTVVSPGVLLRGWVLGSSLPLPSIGPVAQAIPGVQLGERGVMLQGCGPQRLGGHLWPGHSFSLSLGIPCAAETEAQAHFFMVCVWVFFFIPPPPPSLNSGVIPGINLALACIISTVFIMGFFCAEQLDFLFGCLILPHLLHCDG